MKRTKRQLPSIRRWAPLRAALLAPMALAFVGVGGPPVSADELSDLKAQVGALMKRIEDLETKQAETKEISRESV